jgi:hypothetical protein
MIVCGESIENDALSVQEREGGLIPTSPLHFKTVDVERARRFTREHHSRLPYTQRGPWISVLGAFCGERLVSAAFWHNTSARGLPRNWLELRRLTTAAAPPNTCSKFLAWCARHFRRLGYARLVSYQDVAVHAGTIYRAAGWTPTYVSRPRERDRSKPRSGTARLYRWDSNGKAPAMSAKIRWERDLEGASLRALSSEEIGRATQLRASR